MNASPGTTNSCSATITRSPVRAPDRHANDAQSTGIVENLCGYVQRDLAVPLLNEAAMERALDRLITVMYQEHEADFGIRPASLRDTASYQTEMIMRLTLAVARRRTEKDATAHEPTDLE
ncbi:hypothetical protein ACIHDR_43700 [Nocardia sp. NPDC052278]|uniref:hypothetical protein n=1 Tax=unclassified Nocardia TaxID=2637762 RepID=UPI0036B61090